MNRRERNLEQDKSLEDAVSELIDRGYDDVRIIQLLQRGGYYSSEIKEALRYLR